MRVRVLYGPDCGKVVEIVYHAARVLLDQKRAILETDPYPVPDAPAPVAVVSATPPPALSPTPSTTAPAAASLSFPLRNRRR